MSQRASEKVIMNEQSKRSSYQYKTFQWWNLSHKIERKYNWIQNKNATQCDLLFTQQKIAAVASYVNLIRAKCAFAEIWRNLWNLSTKFDLIQNLCALSHYTKANHVCEWERNIFRTIFLHAKSIFTSIFTERTLTQRCRSITKLVRYYLLNVEKF